MQKLHINDIRKLPKNLSGIYKITNVINNRIYIGQGYCIKERIKRHVRYLTKNKHENQYLQNDFNKCNKNIDELLIFQILELCANTKETLCFVEQKYLDLHWDNKKQCYNMAKDATSPYKGLKHTIEAKKKMKEKRKNHIFTIETRKKMSNSLKGKPGFVNTKLCKEIYQYDLSGNFIKKHYSICSAARTIKQIKRNLDDLATITKTRKTLNHCAIKNKNKNLNYSVSNDYVWFYDFKGQKIYIKIKTKKIKLKKPNKISILTKELAYEFVCVKKYSSITISKILGLKNGASAVNKKIKQYGFNTKENQSLNSKGSKNPRATKIKQYSLDGILLNVWGSIIEAADSTNTYTKIISQCCNKKRKSAQGFVWRFINDEF